MIRYASRPVNIEGRDFNAGDIIPPEYHNLPSINDFSRTDAGSKSRPKQQPRKAAPAAEDDKEAAEVVEDAGLTSKSFEDSKVVTTTPEEEEEDTTPVIADGSEVVVEETTTEAPKGRRGRNAQSEEDA